MKIGKILNEVLDINKYSTGINTSLKNLNSVASSNPIVGEKISKDVSDINTNFAALLAQVQAQQAAADEEKKRKAIEDKARMTQQAGQRTGVGSTLPVKKAPPA